MKINNLNDFITPAKAFGIIPDVTDMSGYESPIRMIVGELETKMEADTMSVIQRYGIDVDKEELIKALNYDREQYEKGYREAQSKLKPMCKYLTKCMSHPDISREYHDWCGLYGEDCNCQCCSR